MAGNQFKEDIPENIKVELELLYKKGNFNKALDSSKKLKKARREAKKQKALMEQAEDQ